MSNTLIMSTHLKDVKANVFVPSGPSPKRRKYSSHEEKQVDNTTTSWSTQSEDISKQTTSSTVPTLMVEKVRVMQLASTRPESINYSPEGDSQVSFFSQNSFPIQAHLILFSFVLTCLCLFQRPTLKS